MVDLPEVAHVDEGCVHAYAGVTASEQERKGEPGTEKRKWKTRKLTRFRYPVSRFWFLIFIFRAASRPGLGTYLEPTACERWYLRARPPRPLAKGDGQLIPILQIAGQQLSVLI